MIEGSAGAAASPRPGYFGGLSLRDHSTGKLISISLWDTEADMLASETSANRQQISDRWSNVIVGSIVSEHYEAHTSSLVTA